MCRAEERHDDRRQPAVFQQGFKTQFAHARDHHIAVAGITRAARGNTAFGLVGTKRRQKGGNHMGRGGKPPLAGFFHHLPLCRQVQRQRMAIALAGGQQGFFGDHKTETRHAFDTFVGRRHDRLVPDVAHLQINRAKGGHAVDEQAATSGVNHLGNFMHRVQDAGRGFAMHHHHVGDGGIGGQGGGNLVAPRRHVIALVDHHMVAPQIAHGFRRALAIGAVGQHQHLAVTRNEGAQHRLDREAAAALHRDAIIFALWIVDQVQQPGAQTGRHGAEIAVP